MLPPVTSCFNIKFSSVPTQTSKSKINRVSKENRMCMIKIFRGEGVVDGEEGSSERCLKWGGGGGGSFRDLSENILKQGVGKGKSCS